jgi:purine nucleoside phosphorylase
MLGLIIGSMELSIDGIPVVNRHGRSQTLPHQINYIALMKYLQSSGVDEVIAIHTVGGISVDSGSLVVPQDLIDYTNRPIDLAMPHRHLICDNLFNHDLRIRMLSKLQGQNQYSGGVPVIGWGVMGVTQGPRLETPAEIRRMARDGCTIVGMTAMPEAYCALQMGMKYASLSVVVNNAAGLGSSSEMLPENILRRTEELKPVCEALVRSMA